MPRHLLTEDHVKRILALAQEGHPPRLIHEQLGGHVEITSIYNVISRARKNGAPIKPFPSIPGPAGGVRPHVRFTLDSGDQATLITEAKRRGVSPSQLARRLLKAIIADDMFRAVLDDQVDAA